MLGALICDIHIIIIIIAMQNQIIAGGCAFYYIFNLKEKITAMTHWLRPLVTAFPCTSDYKILRYAA